MYLYAALTNTNPGFAAGFLIACLGAILLFSLISSIFAFNWRERLFDFAIACIAGGALYYTLTTGCLQ